MKTAPRSHLLLAVRAIGTVLVTFWITSAYGQVPGAAGQPKGHFMPPPGPAMLSLGLQTRVTDTGMLVVGADVNSVGRAAGIKRRYDHHSGRPAGRAGRKPVGGSRSDIAQHDQPPGVGSDPNSQRSRWPAVECAIAPRAVRSDSADSSDAFSNATGHAAWRKPDARADHPGEEVVSGISRSRSHTAGGRSHRGATARDAQWRRSGVTCWQAQSITGVTAPMRRNSSEPFFAICCDAILFLPKEATG